VPQSQLPTDLVMESGHALFRAGEAIGRHGQRGIAEASGQPSRTMKRPLDDGPDRIAARDGQPAGEREYRNRFPRKETAGGRKLREMAPSNWGTVALPMRARPSPSERSLSYVSVRMRADNPLWHGTAWIECTFEQRSSY